MHADRPLEAFMLETRAGRLLEVASRRTRTLTVVLDGVHDPHNLSAVIRSSEAFGLLDLHVIESHAPFSLCRKVSQGAEKWLDMHTYPDAAACLRAFGRSHQIWVADPHPGSLPVDEIPFDSPIALVFGNEHEGTSTRMADAAQGSFHIPMWGFAQSFNISVAAGIALAVAVRRREARPEGHGDLPPDERQALTAEWQRRSVKHAEAILERLNAVAEREDERHESPTG